MQLDKAVCVFHLDHHIVERTKRYHTGFEEWYEYYELQWDVDSLREHLFSKIRKCSEVNITFYSNDLDTHTMKNVLLPNDCVVIIEGVFLQREEWCAQ